jgi:hypothetical protein
VRVRRDDGVANRIGPEPCIGIREDEDEASAGERAGQRLSGSDPAWSETLACTEAPCTGTGRSPARSLASSKGWSASGRRGAVADGARAGEVRPLQSSGEAGEQLRRSGGGVGGAKGHHVDMDLLRAAFSWLKRDAAPGVDGLTWREYEQNLEANLVDLHARLHRGAYRALPSRRKFIPKADGRERPLGVAALEDKIVQRASRHRSAWASTLRGRLQFSAYACSEAR